MRLPHHAGPLLSTTLKHPSLSLPSEAPPASSAGAGPSAFRPALLLSAAILLAAAALSFAFWPQIRWHLQALTVLMGINGDSIPRPLQLVADAPVLVVDTTIPGVHGPFPGRLYRPQGIAAPSAVVLVHGLYYMGMDAPDLTSYARRLAACGILVLTPDLAQLRDDRIDGSSIDSIGDSVRWLAAQTHAPVGLMAMSFSGALSLLAAARPENQPSVRFVFVSGTYDSLPRVIRAYAAHREPLPGGHSVPTDGNDYGSLAIEYAYVDHVVPPADRAAVQGVIRARLQRHKRLALQLESALTAIQTAEMIQLQSPDTLRRAATDLGPGLDSLSPRNQLSAFRAPVFVLHGSDDPVIPTGEAAWLVRDLPPGVLRARLISPIFAHAGIGVETHRWKDRWQLVHFFAQVLRTAEAG